MLYRLIFLSGPQTGYRVTVGADPMVLGTDPECDIPVSDAECAKRHAEFAHRGPWLEVRDLGSMNRLLVNRREVAEAKLKHGDLLEIGRTRFLVQCSVQAEVARVPRARSGRRRLVLAGLLAAVLAGYAWTRREPPSVAVLVPPPTPPVVAPVVVTQVVAQAAPARDEKLEEELNSMRQQLADLGGEVRGLSAKPAPTLPPSSSTFRPADPIKERVEKTLAQARQEAAAGNMAEADRLLANVQILDDDFLEAYVQRAALLEKRGMVKKAIDQWGEVIARSIGTPLYDRAVSERIRLGKIDRTLPAEEPALRIVRAEIQRFPESAGYAEMRLLSVVLASAVPEPLDSGAVRLETTFFTHNPAGGDPQVATTIVTSADGEWPAGRERTLTASYVVPKGSDQPPYYGFVAGLYYRDRLQAAEARPPSLLVLGSAGNTDVL